VSELPKGWIITRLDSIAKKIVDGSHNPPPKTAKGLPMLSARNIFDECIQFDSYRFISDEDFAQEHRRTKIKTGDVLLTIVGAIGRSAVVKQERPFVLQRSVAVIGDLSSVDSSYLSKAFQSSDFQAWLNSNAKGTAQQGVYLKALGSSTLPLAPLAEQRRIVAKIDSLSSRSKRAHGELEGLNVLFDRFRSSLLEQEFRNFNVANCSLSDCVADGLIGLVRSKGEQFENCGTPYIRMQHFDLSGRWNFSSLSHVKISDAEADRYALKPNDVLFNTRNSSDLVGKVSIWPGSETLHVFNNNLLRIRFRPRMNPRFAYLQMRSPQFRYMLESLKSATTSVAAIYQKPLYELPFWCPEADKQLEIVLRIEHAFAAIDRLAAEAQSARALLDKLDQAILAKAFRGELVPQDPNDEPASVLLDRIRAERAAAPAKPRAQKRKAKV